MDPNLDTILSQLRALRRPAAHLRPTDRPVASRIGGLPDVPPRFAWPEGPDAHLAFIAQLDLGEVNGDGRIEILPRAGRLLFFYDVCDQPWGFYPDERARWAVVHLPPDQSGTLRAATAPADLDEEDAPRRAVPLDPVAIDSLPSPARLDVDLDEVADSTFDEIDQVLARPFGTHPRHQVGGFPCALQPDTMELQCELIAQGISCDDESIEEDPRFAMLVRRSVRWRLLLQLDSDDAAGLSWGDAGMLYFWIPEEAARSRRFDEVWVILQCM